MSKFTVYVSGTPFGEFECEHFKFYCHSTMKFCPACKSIWAQIFMHDCDEAWPEICYCAKHAKQAESKLFPNIYVVQMPLPGSILDAWCCLPDHPERDPLDFLPEELIRQEFELYMHLIDLGIITDEHTESFIPSPKSSTESPADSLADFLSL